MRFLSLARAGFVHAAIAASALLGSSQAQDMMRNLDMKSPKMTQAEITRDALVGMQQADAEKALGDANFTAISTEAACDKPKAARTPNSLQKPLVQPTPATASDQTRITPLRTERGPNTSPARPPGTCPRA